MSSVGEPLTLDACPGDEVLMAHLDDALGDADRAALDRHLDSCEECARRIRALADRSRRLGAWLQAHDPEPPSREAYDVTPPRRRVIRPRQWAIAASVVLAVGVAAGPARGWLLHRLGLADEGPVAEVAPPAVDATTGTSFVPRGGEVVLVFDAGVAGRRLMVSASEDSVATLVSPTSDAAVVLRPDRLEIHDAGTVGGEYRLSVPGGVSQVRLRVPGDQDVVIPVGAAAPEGRVVEIGSGGR